MKNNSTSRTLQRTKNGSILVFALIVLSFILLATFSLSSIANIERRSADISVNSSTAFQQADKGMEEFLQQIYKDLDQSDDLNAVADALGDEYKCCGVNGQNCTTSPGPARIGNQDTQFIITAYRDKGDTVDSNGKETGGWNSGVDGNVMAIEDCNTALADVVRFRSTGNHNNAARAVFLRLKDSLTRGLVAHWSFEDRAQNARLTGDDDLKNSFMVGDSSKNNYSLTLCGLDTGDDDSITISDGDIDEDNNSVDVYIEPFDNCDNSSPLMSQKKRGDNCDECDSDGAWVDGIVSELGVAGAFGNDGTEALYFNGVDNYITALVDDGDCHGAMSDCDVTANYVNAESVEELGLEDGIAISAWVKMDGATGDNVIVSRWYDEEGYQLLVDATLGEICFKLNDKELCESYGSDINADTWANIVVAWRKVDGDMTMHINADLSPSNETFVNSIDTPANVPLSIGAQLDDNQNAASSEFFAGSIDDVRIWNRVLTECEISKICRNAFDQDNSPSDAPNCADVPVSCQ